jgi:hypothetical protein
MFSDPTVAGLAAAVAGAGGDGADSPAAPPGPPRADPGGAQAGDALHPLLPGDRR